MKIGILSRSLHTYSTRRLKEAAQERGHQVKALDTLRFGIFVEEEAPSLTFRGKLLSTYDAIIPRIGTSITFYGTAVVRQFEQMGVYTLNPSHAITVSRDKLRSLQVLSRHDIGLPHSAFVRDKRDILEAIERVGGAPVVIKLLEGTQGVGVVLAETVKQAESIIEMLHSTKQNILVQKFVKESRGKDIRALVVGNHVVAAMRRTAAGTEFRSNIHRGGSAEAVELTPEFENTAVRAAQIMGLRVAGVDMLEGADGPKIMEVNSSPGLEGIEGATGADVAGRIIEYLEEQAAFDDVDIRQRLSLTKGYGVVEFTVNEAWEISNKNLANAGLGERDVTVLNIRRGDVVIPVPHGETQILPGDLLLCYGKLQTLREFTTPLEQKRQRKISARSKASSGRNPQKEEGEQPGG